MRLGDLAYLCVLAALASCASFTAADSSPNAGGVPDGGGSEGGAGAKSPYAAAVLEDAPILYYRLGEGTTAGPVVDLSVAPRNATVKGKVKAGVPSAIVNDPDTAFHFDGTTGAVFLPDGPTFAGTMPYTVEAWVQPTSFVGGRVFAACQAAPNGGWAIYFDNDAKPHFERQTTLGTDGITGPAVTGTGFTHLVGTFDGTTQRLYVDGVFATAAPSTQVNPGSFGVPFVIGANGATAEINQFEGDIDEVAIYDHVLSEQRIRLHHMIGSGLGP